MVTGETVALLTSDQGLIDVAVDCGVGFGASMPHSAPGRHIQFQSRIPVDDWAGRERSPIT